MHSREEIKTATKEWNLKSKLDAAAQSKREKAQTETLSNAADEAKIALGYCAEGGCWLSRPNYFMLLRSKAKKAFDHVTGGDDVLGTRLCTGQARGNSTSSAARVYDEAMARNDKLLEKAYGQYLTMGCKTNYWCNKTVQDDGRLVRANGLGYAMLYDPTKVKVRHSQHSHHSHHSHDSHDSHDSPPTTIDSNGSPWTTAPP